MPYYVLLLTFAALFGFFAIVSGVVLRNPRMFTKRHGRLHRVMGLCYFVWLGAGFVDSFIRLPVDRFLYDAVLGILGVILTLTAAFEFQHKHVTNVASGSLDPHATITHGEMIEHSFYQGLNLLQIVFLHFVSPELDLRFRALMVLAVTSPWMLRHHFPVNKFSDNYTKVDLKSTALVRFLYRIKKYQYVFYKHFLLHGLNLSVAISGDSLADRQFFRLYWMSLNASYVFEFFLQTLVKKKYMEQNTLLILQRVLMAEASIVSLYVLGHVSPVIAVSSLLLNFINRKHDMMNTTAILLIFTLFNMYNKLN